MDDSRYAGLSDKIKSKCKELDDILQKEYGVYLNDEDIKLACAVAFSNKNMMIVGPPGTGKTSFAKAFSKVANKPYYRITAYPDISRYEIIGDWDYRRQLLAVESGVPLSKVYTREFFNAGEAMKALEHNGVLHIDEINRGGDELQNTVLELAGEKQITVPMLGTIKGDAQIIATYNEGDIATVELSNAFNRRFVRVEFSHPTKKQFELALEEKYGKDVVNKVNEALLKLAEGG